MDAYKMIKSAAISMIVRDTPRDFWKELSSLGNLVYADTFDQVKNDTSIIESQKLDYLVQRRHFRMESLLVNLAVSHGLTHTMGVIVQNNRHHAYIFNGDVSMTQSYVQAIGSLPQPAKFRNVLANTMELPRLDLGDEPDGAFIMRKLYGLVAHNPVGRRFREEEQRLGMIQFCIPSIECKAWALEFSITELVSAYPVAQNKPAVSRSLPWKKRMDGKNVGKSK